ncbi:hypothetical protein HYE00_03800 [Mycoplasmopsis bovis]|nr:hypothetical protein [Mycoplasmopsis bovis]QQH28803.1 hypothetical protein HYE00_03800 [Mycoplasmopsis bovis]
MQELTDIKVRKTRIKDAGTNWIKVRKTRIKDAGTNWIKVQELIDKDAAINRIGASTNSLQGAGTKTRQTCGQTYG